ncbi:TRAP transporter small permease [Pseudooceanicola sediminis]|uniref:TRAP transporter small permease protein n=2 Tax=Pseudooceanicola sediminis TaxID=2211117 RepID=A0A399IZQ3_9RHOB|nr:TRAP transporter small permease [Puniceibacterium sp. HSS470]RII38555.1 TRAP transporter small permease [Pseudooceanicola sediminis]|tara:strand:+ start:4197 stop:4766 length:570 start_codon:yes stop_codon:yes gene_type:complete
MALARIMAILGGLVLTVLILLTVVSVFGRTLNGILHWEWLEAIAPGGTKALLDLGVGPVLGDFELVEAGIAFTIFAFLPLTQITASHATVDVFTAILPVTANRVLIAFWEVIFAIAMVIIAWRLYDGMLGKMRYNETTFLLQFPVWWAYAASFGAAVVAAVVTVYTALVRLIELVRDRAILPDHGGAGH